MKQVHLQHILLDASGSMQDCHQRTVSTLNEQVLALQEVQKQHPDQEIKFSLQRGCSNHILLDRARFLGQAVTEENFVMRTLVDASGHRGIPFVGRVVPLGPFHGEVYAVDHRTLVGLDRFEGCVPDEPLGSWYCR